MNIRKYIQKSKLSYRQIEKVYCPALEAEVHFSMRGFKHLLYKSNKKPRTTKDQYLRLRLLEYVREIIKSSTQVYQVRSYQTTIKGRSRVITHYAIQDNDLAGLQAKVIIEQVGAGRHYFLSIMPTGKRNKKRP